jgi:transcriptional regulator with PAS, ATPase and Fis domain
MSVGDSAPVPVDIRVLAATHRPGPMLAAATFRQVLCAACA